MLKYLVFAVAIAVCQSKQFERCELAKALRNHGFPEGELRNWVCLVENESHSRTDIIGKVNHDGSRDYGLFQINDKYWCSNTNTPGKDCHVTCAELLTDDIAKASKCAEKIFKRHGFMAWYGWRNHCQNKPLRDISRCR